MKLVGLRMNYERKNFWGDLESFSEYTEWFRDSEHAKALIRKGLAFIQKGGYGLTCMHVIFVAEDGNKYNHAIYEEREDSENGTLSSQTSFLFPPYSKEEVRHIATAQVRRHLYELCK